MTNFSQKDTFKLITNTIFQMAKQGKTLSESRAEVSRQLGFKNIESLFANSTKGALDVSDDIKTYTLLVQDTDHNEDWTQIKSKYPLDTLNPEDLAGLLEPILLVSDGDRVFVVADEYLDKQDFILDDERLIDAINGNPRINAQIKTFSGGEGWGVMDIQEEIHSTFGISLDLDDTDLFEKLLKIFNA
jgi:hypothetical protein